MVSSPKKHTSKNILRKVAFPKGFSGNCQSKRQSPEVSEIVIFLFNLIKGLDFQSINRLLPIIPSRGTVCTKTLPG